MECNVRTLYKIDTGIWTPYILHIYIYNAEELVIIEISSNRILVSKPIVARVLPILPRCDLEIHVQSSELNMERF